jgi:hypothetical protein
MRWSRPASTIDLGEGVPESRKLLLWMAENDVWPTKSISVHSANPVAVDYMSGLIERYGGFEKELGRPVFRLKKSRFRGP